jgi:thiol-disulfide isomerase/thioredoxin
MKKLILLLLFPVILISGCSEKKVNFISKVVNEMKSHNSVSYKATEKYYYENEPDTITTPFDIRIVRDKDDSAKNGYIWVDNHYRPYKMIYDKGDFYFAIPPKKTTVLYAGFNEDFISPIDWIDIFLKPDILTGLVNDPETNAKLTDTVYRGEDCVKISLSSTGAAKKITYFISKKRFTPLCAKLETINNGKSYINQLLFSDYKFDELSLSKLHAKQQKVFSDNPVDRKGSTSEISRLEQMLHIGDKAPLFDGAFYSTGENFNLSDYIGKNVIIVDFWYTHCPPCVKAMPFLSELNTKYKDKGLKIFGLNSVDNQPHSLKNLKTFLENRELSYDVVMTQPEVDIKYKINGYPTMYVVDKEGKIAYVEVGFYEEKFEILKAKVKELLD